MLEPRVLLAGLFVGILGAGCSSGRRPIAAPNEQSNDQIHVISYTVAGPAGRRVQTLPSSAYAGKWFFQSRWSPRRPPRHIPKISGDLLKLLQTLPPDQKLRVFVSFKDVVPIPRFPRGSLRMLRTDSLNQAMAESAADSVDSLRMRRSLQYQADTASFAGFGARVIRTHWLIQASLVEVEAGQIIPLSASPSIRHIRLNQGSGPPSHDTRKNDLDKGWQSIHTDHYVDLGYGNGWVALLDTGIRTAHQLLCNPNRLCKVLDCVHGDCASSGDLGCSVFDASCHTDEEGDADALGHGTASAAILTGNGNLGVLPEGTRPFQGATEAIVDCFRVYDDSDKVDVDATVQAFELAVNRLDQIVIAEMAETSIPDIADVGAAADHAYEAGAIVIAANGNSTGSRAGQPAQGRHVIGAGVYDITNDTPIEESWGTEDGRTKPEILGPSYTESAGNGSDTDLFAFGGTSGSTPYVAAAAVVLRDWLSEGGWSDVDPGEIYAHLILGGDTSGPFSDTDRFGAGKLRLPVNGESWSVKVSLTENDDHVDVPVQVTGSGWSRITAAIWWPEAVSVDGSSLSDTRNDLDLEIRAPGWGRPPKAVSESVGGVFERASWVEPSGIHGKWTIRVKWATTVVAPQEVYVAVALAP